MASTDGKTSNDSTTLSVMNFQPDKSSKKRKGIHRPMPTKVFSKPSNDGVKPSKVFMLVNPYSGKKKGLKVAEAAKQLLEASDIEVEMHISQHSGHLVDIASSLDVQSDQAIAVVGGDGSLSESITGWMMQSKDNSTIRFGMIPAGTGNSQAHDFGIKSTEDAVSRIVNGSAQSIDLARVELTEGLPGKNKGQMIRYSHNLVTWGLGVDSTIKAEKMRWMGSIRYDVGILMAIMANNRRHASLYLDGHKMEDDFTLFLIQNSQTGGSLLPLAPGASLDDGLMDIGILKKMTRRDILKAFGLLKKEGRHVFHPRVDYHQFKELRIETPEPTAINIDGENIGSTPLSMEVLPSVVQVFH